MSTASPANPGPSPPQPPAGNKKASAKSKAEWLAPAILTARTITAAAECAPFPYIKGVSGTVLILLETVQKVKKNREDFKELCNSTTEIVMILYHQIVAHGNTVAVKFKDLCEELESYLAAVILAIQNLQDQSKGFRGRVKEFVKSSSITDEITGYQQKIQGLCSKLQATLLVNVDTNLKVDEIYAAVTAPGFTVVTAVESINNCPPPSRNFQGRQTILEKMHQFFGTGSGKQLIYVLHGLGGAGKTQIALKFIQESLARFSDTFLVDASTLDTIDTGLKNLAMSKNVGDSAQDALTWLQSKHGDWLLFFDNADDPKINLNQFFPQCNHGSIVITSRNPELRVYGGHSPVSDMEEADAIALLLQSAAKESSEDSLQVAAEIVKELYYLPLAIVQAGAFISKSGNLDGYLRLYAENRAQLLGKKPEQSHDQYAWTVYTTWQISFDQLSRPAAMLLQLCSFLHHSGISEDMFSNASKYGFPVWLPAKGELQEPLQFLAQFLGPTRGWSSLSFLDVANEIMAYSLITFDAATQTFSIHPLVHAWSWSTISDKGSSHLCIRSILGMSISKIPDHDIILLSLRLMPHVGALSFLNANAGADFRAAFWGIYLGAGKLKDAQNLIEQTLEKYRLVYGEEHLASLEVMHRLAVTYRRLGEYKKAEKLEATVLDRWTNLLGEDHPDTLRAMGNLASTHSDLGNSAKAKELQVLVLGVRTKLLGEDHPETLTAMGNLAATYSDLGDFKKAKELKVTVLKKRTTLLGANHPETLSAMGSLATTYLKLGDFRKAKELQVTVLEKGIGLLGEAHCKTLTAMGNLAVTHSELGDLVEAKELQVLVLGAWTKLLGEDHPETLTAMRNLAVTYSELGDFEKAKKLKLIVLEKQTTLLGENHPETLTAMGNLAATHSELGHFKEAEGLEITVLAKRITLLGEDHPDTLKAMGNLASTHSDLQDFAKAKELQLLVLEARTKLLGEDHPETLTAMGDLAATHSDLGDFEKAKELKVLVLKRCTELLGEDHPNTLRAMENLAITHSALGDFTKSKELKAIVLEKRTKRLGEDHPDTLRTMGNVAATYSELGDFAKAKELTVIVLKKRTKLLGEDHPETLSAMGNLATTYFQLGDFEKAKELQVTVLEKLVNLLGEDHPKTLRVMGNLTTTHFRLRDFTSAKELQVTVLEKQTKVLGEDHPQTLETMGNLAWAHSALGDFAKANELQVTVLEKQTKVLGEDHPQTLNTMFNLAATCCNQGGFQRAAELGIVVLEKRRKLLGDQHPDTVSAMQILAIMYRVLDKLMEAEELEQLIQNSKTAS
ncbi:hypothetical protein C8F04DRAFT_1328470 [Mycena alexandri]|uniref:DUF7779 domain-containing protein n=1 Tax=Mycena alexandri TaxID=1745969 RepID=A0AAD6WNT6_9AGAR|nr:hypothetical protein C8F04DRAFT_1328470 [Mycena alexandri]